MAVALPVFYHGGPPWQQHVYRDNNVLYYIPFGQKRREHIQEALKYTAVNMCQMPLTIPIIECYYFIERC